MHAQKIEWRGLRASLEKNFSAPPPGVGATPARRALGLAQRRSAVRAAETAVGAVGFGVVAGGAQALQVGGVGGKVGAGAPGKDMVDVRCAGLASAGSAGAAPRFALKLVGA